MPLLLLSSTAACFISSNNSCLSPAAAQPHALLSTHVQQVTGSTNTVLLLFHATVVGQLGCKVSHPLCTFDYFGVTSLLLPVLLTPVSASAPCPSRHLCREGQPELCESVDIKGASSNGSSSIESSSSQQLPNRLSPQQHPPSSGTPVRDGQLKICGSVARQHQQHPAPLLTPHAGTLTS
jgi:hypothetical protein